MISLLFAVWVGALPLDCNANLDCFLAVTLKTCGPARLEDPNLDPTGAGKRAGEVPMGVTEYLVAPSGKGEQCTLTIQTRVDAYELSAILVSQLGRATEKRRARGLQLAKDNGASQRCELSAEQIKKAFERLQRGEKPQWPNCQQLGCSAVLPADNGCAWSECKDAVRTLSCGEGVKELVCAPVSSLGPQVSGRASMLLREHLDDERPCVAVCREAKGEPQVVCH